MEQTIHISAFHATEQDKRIEKLAETLDRTKGIAIDINDEVGEHIHLLNGIQTKTEKTSMGYVTISS